MLEQPDIATAAELFVEGVFVVSRGLRTEDMLLSRLIRRQWLIFGLLNLLIAIWVSEPSRTMYLVLERSLRLSDKVSVTRQQSAYRFPC